MHIAHTNITVLEVVVPYSPDTKIAISLPITIIIWVIRYKLTIMVHDAILYQSLTQNIIVSSNYT